MDYSDFPVDKASSGGNCREDFEKRIREAIAQDCRRRANIAYDKDPQLLIDIIELIKKTSEEIAGVIERMAPSNDSLDSAMQHAFFGELIKNSMEDAKSEAKDRVAYSLREHYFGTLIDLLAEPWMMGRQEYESESREWSNLIKYASCRNSEEHEAEGICIEFGHLYPYVERRENVVSMLMRKAEENGPDYSITAEDIKHAMVNEFQTPAEYTSFIGGFLETDHDLKKQLSRIGVKNTLDSIKECSDYMPRQLRAVLSTPNFEECILAVMVGHQAELDYSITKMNAETCLKVDIEEFYT